MSPRPLKLAVVGATGAVGRVMLELLDDPPFPVAEIGLFASERSAGRRIGERTVRALAEDAIDGFDVALLSAGGGTSREWAPRFAATGCVVVDNSSAWRMDPEVPLVVSEVNPEALDGHRGIVANPNCSTMQLMVALKPLQDAAGIERLVVATYQSVSGTGVKAIDELHAQARAVLAGDEPPEPQVYPHPIAFNVIGAAGNFPPGSDATDEERKMVFETRKILGDQSIRVSVTCARVPVVYGHSLAVNAELRKPLPAAEARALLERAPGITVVDDPATHSHPTALAAAGRDDVLVGRIRDDESNPNTVNLWVVADNLRKGAATNAVQLVEQLHTRGLVGVRAAA